jgi:type IV secretory pathway component VirB8
MPHAENPSAEYTEIAEKIRSGEFFRESRNMYDFTVHDPMVERYLYLLISGLAAAILIVAIIAVNGLYPLKGSVPFIVSSNNIVEDRPNIHSLIAKKGESPSAAVLRFVAQNYVKLREEYDINTFDRNVNGVQSQSSPELFQEYQQQSAPSNPESPIAQYQRHSRRTVNVLYTRQTGADSMEVTFEATVISKTEVKKSHWQANMTFNYTGIALDETTGKVKPFTFVVTGYKVKRLQDIK